MDGRLQRKVAAYLSVAFRVRHLDTITTAGLVRHLVSDTEQTPTLFANLDISLTAHGSHRVAIVGHHDCAGNPVSDEQQTQQIADAVQRLSTMHPEAELVGLWVNQHWTIEEVARA